MLTLFDTDGTTVIGTNNDVHYNDNVFDALDFREADPFLLNLSLPAAGTYYLQVEAFTPATELAGDNYILLTATTKIPEPSTLLLAALGQLGLLGFIRRRRYAA